MPGNDRTLHRGACYYHHLLHHKLRGVCKEGDSTRRTFQGKPRRENDILLRKNQTQGSGPGRGSRSRSRGQEVWKSKDKDIWENEEASRLPGMWRMGEGREALGR